MTMSSREDSPVIEKSKKRLLVVDDEPVICQLVVDSFSKTDFLVFTAKDGLEALKLIDGHHGAIDALLVDIIMPILNGTELARIVLSSHPRIKIIFMSGQADDIIDHYGIPQYRIRYIRKPFGPKELVNAVCEELLG